MNELNFLSALLIGVAGGVHCVGMCGGIIGAFSYAIPKNAAILPYTFAYNFGRIFSYTLAGSLAGGLGYLFAHHITQGIVVLQFISGLFLFSLGLYIAGWWQGLVKIEKLGGHIWQSIRPWSKSLLPFKSPLYALPYGMIWGWLPCGLVYSVLTWSLASGSVTKGAWIMAGFGLGTLPIMILMALGFEKLKGILQHANTKRILGILLMVFAAVQIFNAINATLHT